MMNFQQIFSFFKILIFGSFKGDKRAKNDLKLPISICYALYLRNWRLYHWDFVNDIYRCFSFFFFLQKYNIVNIKIILFFIGPLQQFFNNCLFFKFINKCKREILRCTPSSSHVCDFFLGLCSFNPRGFCYSCTWFCSLGGERTYL